MTEQNNQIDQLVKIKNLLQNVSIIKDINIINNNIRIQTIFLYHDTHYIDIFIPQNKSILTDFGTTISLCYNYYVKIDYDLMKEHFLCNDDIVFENGALCCEVKEDFSNLTEKLLELVQVCIKVSVYIHCVYLAQKNLL